jgi:electron transfer flavoprotein alpha subunit/NAD-dependent dihydropyrimidine dehydrogenase PreA subunit
MKSSIEVLNDKCTGCGLCLKACPVNVIRMDKVEGESKAVIDPGCVYCSLCISACPFQAIEMKIVKDDVINLSEYRGVMIFAESEERDDSQTPVLLSVSKELLSEGRKLADELDAPLWAFLPGENLEGRIKECFAFGADEVYKCDSPLLSHYRDEPYARLLSEAIVKHKPEIVLLGATTIGRELASRTAVRIGTGLTADCTSLEVDLPNRLLIQNRPAFGGNLMASILCPNHRPQMATVRPRVMAMDTPDWDRQGLVIDLPLSLDENDIRTKIKQIVKVHGENVNLSEAEIIVAGGRGLGAPENFKLIRELAEALGGVVGASRATVDDGWIEAFHQVGQTGKTVSPKLYIACGISGALQHRAGMQTSRTIIAINSDPGAPIFKIATIGLCGDLFKVIPELIREIKACRQPI